MLSVFFARDFILYCACYWWKKTTSSVLNKGEYCFQFELAGNILGKGVGLSKEEAKLQSDLICLRSTMLTQRNFQDHQGLMTKMLQSLQSILWNTFVRRRSDGREQGTKFLEL
ncbi:hypothetical protein OPV22_001898 [Ensete ventricosum]|uniref:Uncharacterized protein n=1 Tax=Ensete ventricosum TaxID=4639 RepID=A0AAV8RWK5_ENSVE|nr:hypothetical protein OPV22_001898 [Ensete ventricosum]